MINCFQIKCTIQQNHRIWRMKIEFDDLNSLYVDILEFGPLDYLLCPLYNRHVDHLPINGECTLSLCLVFFIFLHYSLCIIEILLRWPECFIYYFNLIWMNSLLPCVTHIHSLFGFFKQYSIFSIVSCTPYQLLEVQKRQHESPHDFLHIKVQMQLEFESFPYLHIDLQKQKSEHQD